MLSRKTRLVSTSLVLICFAGIQFIRPGLPNPPVTADINAPADVKQILKASCYDCHSNETALKWFDQVAPAWWLVADHVKKGREALNFSHWDSLSPAAQKGNIYLSVNQVLFKEMPFSSYTALHGSAKLSDKEISILKNYALSLSPLKPSDSAAFNAAARQYAKQVSEHSSGALRQVKPALNGIEYMPGYGDWKALSTTDRYDNGSMRIIFGNAIAVKAVESGQINPWPDGTVFAKVAWEQLADSTGMVHPGSFKQVEYMIKDSKKYASTNGWGWARWLGTRLIPYGKDASFANECVSCHQPLKPTDYVFTEPLALTKTPAALPAGVLEWKVAATMIDRQHKTMSTLYGNDAAIDYARGNRSNAYPKDAALALVTWQQRPDGRWFGANIPGAIESARVVTSDTAFQQLKTLIIP